MEDNKITNYIDRFRLPLALSLIGVVLILGGIFTSGMGKSKKVDIPKESILEKTDIFVDVEGAVNKPGVVKIASDSRIEDVIREAGGFDEKVDKQYVARSINLAQKAIDGSKIYIPFEGEDLVTQSEVLGIAGSTDSKVNINASSKSQLEALSGIGPVTAEKIISARPYQSIEELISKKIVGKAVFEKIKDQLVVY